MKEYKKPTVEFIELKIKENLASTPSGKYDPVKNAWVWTYDILQMGSA